MSTSYFYKTEKEKVIFLARIQNNKIQYHKDTLSIAYKHRWSLYDEYNNAISVHKLEKLIKNDQTHLSKKQK